MNTFPVNDPYSYRLKYSPFMRLWLGNHWEILFEDSPIRVLRCSTEEIQDLVNLLNTAWILGFTSGAINERVKHEINNK